MPRFFSADISGDRVCITGEDAAHLARALRLKPGEQLTVCDGNGSDYLCTACEVTSQLVTAQVVSRQRSAGEPPVPITLYQALCKGDKLELIVQKAVELGATQVVPVQTKRCVSRPESAALARKVERWQKIAAEAAKQSGRGRIPAIAQPLDFGEAISCMKKDPKAILFYEEATLPLGKALGRPEGGISIMTGPEGGFEPEEVAHAEAQGVQICSLGPRILRCETAPLCALSIIAGVLEIL